MPATTQILTVPGPMLERGFWLYVWRVESPAGEYLYVGRTGDSSSPFATPPYQRMGQHLGHQPNQNMLRKHLVKRGVEPERCAAFHLVAYGPIFPQAADMDAHREPRDIVAALEKELALALAATGYAVMNTVNCRKPVDAGLFRSVRAAFAEHFPALTAAST